MQYKFNAYCIPLGFSSLATLLLAVYGLKKWKVLGARPFVLCMLDGTVWSLCNALEIQGTSLSTKLFWSDLQYLTYGFAPIGFALLAFQFTGHERWLRIRNIALMSAIPALTAVLVWFDIPLGLVRRNLSLASDYSFPILQKDFAPIFWVDVANTYILYAFSFILLIQVVLGKNRSYRRQSACLIAGFGPIGGSNILYLAGLSPIRHLDITPSLFFIEGLIAAWGIFKYRLLDLSPIARDLVFENMGGGGVVTDIRNRVLDVNEAFERMVAQPEASIIGKKIDEIAEFLFRPMDRGKTTLDSSQLEKDRDPAPVMWQTRREEIKGAKEEFYEVNASPLRDSRGKPIGWAYIVYDTTNINHAREEIQRQQRALAISEEQHRVARDLHDNIGQVLSFSSIQMQTIQRELVRGNTDLAISYLKRAQTTVEQAHDDLREYIFNLRSPEMQSASFESLLIRLSREILQDTAIDFRMDLDPKVLAHLESAERKNHLLSLTKEAVNNIMKHSGATRITIGAQGSSNGYEYYIEDNGKGFSLSEGSPPGSSGLRIMEEHSLLTGGRLRVFSSCPGGTRISVRYPSAGGEKE